jgi:hypothetical protein
LRGVGRTRLDTVCQARYDVRDVFGICCNRFDIGCDIHNGGGTEKAMKRLLELFKKIRKPMPRPTMQHPDKTKYSRRTKHKKSDEENT